jgi:hypothetical protein
MNFLFRGSLPLSGSPKSNRTVPIDSIVETLQSVASSTANISVPDDVYFEDFSLLNEADFRANLPEQKWWRSNSERGNYTQWPIYGSPSDPEWYEDKKRRDIVAEHPWDIIPDDMSALMASLRSKLHARRADGRSTAIYIHCTAGVDRTGQVAGGYYMRYLNATFGEALRYDASVEPRCISLWSRHGLNWYCYSQKYGDQPQLECAVPADLRKHGSVCKDD